MGQDFLDGYSLLHFSTGVVAFHWGVTLPHWLFHTAFEVVENTDAGMKFINEQLTRWPGGKPTLQNAVGDTVAAGFGWWVASLF